MSEYIPSTDEVRLEYMAVRWAHSETASFEARAEFDRWLAKHDAEIAAKAWSEGWSARASRGYAHLKVGECVPPPAHINPYRKAVQ